MASYLMFGNLTVDDTVFPDGTTAMRSLGGNALYAAIGAWLWRADVAIVTRVGRDYPQDLLVQLREAGLCVDGLVRRDSHYIRQWQLYDVEGGRVYVPLRSAPSYADMTPRPSEVPAAVAEGVVGGHVAPDPVELQGPLVEWLKSKGARVTLDPHGDWIAGHMSEWRALLPMVDVFLPSREEAEIFLGHWPGAMRAARALADLGAGTVCLKLGAAGCIVYETITGLTREYRSVAKRVIDTTGCGDAFCGAFLAGWGGTGCSARGVSQGLVAAAIVAADYGATGALRADREEVTRRFARAAQRSEVRSGSVA